MAGREYTRFFGLMAWEIVVFLHFSERHGFRGEMDFRTFVCRKIITLANQRPPFYRPTDRLLSSPPRAQSPTGLRNGPEVGLFRGALPLGPPPPRTSPCPPGLRASRAPKTGHRAGSDPSLQSDDVPLPGMARRTSDSTNFYTNLQTAESMPRTSEELVA